MLTGIKVNTDGTLVVVQIEDANHVTGIQQALDARWYDVASMRPGLDVFVDDEGLFTSKLNPTLTAMAQAFGYAGVLHGPGIFFGVTEHDGATVSLDAAQIAAVATQWVEATSYRNTPVVAGLAFLAH